MADHPSPDQRPVEEQLGELRTRIDAVDQQLLQLLNQRAQLAQAVGEVKKIDSSPVFRPDREAQVIDKLKNLNPGPIQADSIAPIWREIMSACRSLEAKLKVAFLGPIGTFSEQAALDYFGSSIDALPCPSIDEVFRATVAGSADFGVVPVENSTEGVVARSLDLLLQSPVTIIGETSLLVSHNLLRKEPLRAGIKVVCAHPQALAQCQGWLSQNLPDAERRPVSSNAEGARLAGKDASIAALASTRAASRYGLHVLQAGVQDDAHNRTRFVIISQPEALPASAPTGHDCTSLIVSVDNRPGAVHDMLVPLKHHGVSMTRFESRPARSGQWEYVFYMDLAGHPAQDNVAAAMSELRAQCSFFKVLGTYPLDVH
ncbi:prephenate dehydratase [Aquabacterium sp. CECT 9606]|uniref:prephenate dehydratase n=1 Tax=Aquabacterium sp. CECT 9606 TaxID=2845822 RepID=UPI001E5B2E18|nr:prephenate dehydratase [Aquabacterium sp. CECT 9606]CAH0354163.1 Bifunctional chorismate mutase/prephenate dehydratase [Aquabacterium sp. CECT 9606]